MTELAYIETPLATKSAHTRKETTGKKTRVRSSVQVAKDDYRRAKAIQKGEIAKLRNQIKMHKLLIKQAKNSYKLITLANK